MMNGEVFRAELCEWTLAVTRDENAHTPRRICASHTQHLKHRGKELVVYSCSVVW